MTIILTTDELERVTGYKTPKRQVQELHRQGFYRARIAAVTGNVILERAQHTGADCGLHSQQKGDQVHRDTLNQDTYLPQPRRGAFLFGERDERTPYFIQRYDW